MSRSRRSHIRTREDYEICFPNPLELKTGELIRLFEKDVPEKWKGWNWCKDSKGNEGWISETYFQRTPSGQEAKITRDYYAREISASAGEEVKLVYEDCGWAWCENSKGQTGWLPTEILDGSMDLPEFDTKRLHLRGVKLSDAQSYQKNFVDYEVIRHLSHLVPWPYPEKGVYEYFKDLILPAQGITRWTWAVFLKEEKNEVIGVVDIWRKGLPENRGFWLAKKHWGKGYMTEALAPVTDYAFNELHFEKMTFANAAGNIRSRRIKEKTGAILLETRPAQFVDPEYTETEIWELTRDNWTKNQ